VTSNADGAFELVIAESGPVVVAAQAPGYELGSVLIREASEQSEDAIEIVLQRSVEFAGRVLAPDDAPVFRAQVSIAPMGSRSRRGPLEAWTDQQGRFRIDGVHKTGPYKVTINHFAHPPLVALEQAVGTGHAYHLEPQGRILGTILDAASGGPVTRYQYAVLGPVRRQASAVSISGAFEVDQLPQGNYALTLDADGYESGSIDAIPVGLGETVENIVVRLQPAGSIVGRVRGPIPAGMTVHARGQDRSLEAEAVIAEDGAFSLSDLPSGKYTLSAVGVGEEGEVRGEVENVLVESGSITRDIEILVAPVASGPG
jgi:hypothetical protein